MHTIPGNIIPGGNGRFGNRNIPPQNVSPPVISGPPVVGQALTCNVGTWIGLPNPTFSYQWRRGAVNIGTNSPNYTLTQADAGNLSNINCVVTGVNVAGSASATSNTIVRILDALTNAYITGLTLTSAEIDSFNTLYLDLRAAGYHTQLDRLHIYGSATQAASNKSLFGNFTATPVNSPTWTRKVGYTHTGTSYIRTAYTPSINGVTHTLNNNSYGIGFNNLPNTADSMLGGATTGIAPISGLTIYSNTNSLLVRNYFSGNSTASTNRLLSDTYAATVRTNANNVINYLNSVSAAAVAAVNNPIVNLELWEGGRNLNNTPSLLMTSGSVSRYGYNGSATINPVIMNNIITTFINSL
jgi:hypothetical protein